MPQNTTLASSTARLLKAGIVAGPLFIGVWLIQALTRDGFDPTRHPISLLSTGDFGWIQIANFVVAGALCVGASVGLRQAMTGGRGGTWGPRLVGAFGVGLITAGIFVTDPGAGFPAGAPAGAPEHFSWHAILHEIGFVVAQLSWLAACVVLARRFAGSRQRGRALACVATAVSTVVTAAWPDFETLSLRLVLATAIEFGLIAGVAAHFLRLPGGVPLSDRATVRGKNAAVCNRDRTARGTTGPLRCRGDACRGIRTWLNYRQSIDHIGVAGSGQCRAVSPVSRINRDRNSQLLARVDQSTSVQEGVAPPRDGDDARELPENRQVRARTIVSVSWHSCRDAWRVSQPEAAR